MPRRLPSPSLQPPPSRLKCVDGGDATVAVAGSGGHDFASDNPDGRVVHFQSLGCRTLAPYVPHCPYILHRGNPHQSSCKRNFRLATRRIRRHHAHHGQSKLSNGVRTCDAVFGILYLAASPWEHASKQKVTVLAVPNWPFIGYPNCAYRIRPKTIS